MTNHLESTKANDREDVLKKALVELRELRAKVSVLELARTEPIAVIGMACRLPGNVCDPESFWCFLQSGGDGIIEIPGDRWDVNAFYDPNRSVPGKMYTRRGGFVRD